jgi:GAF domain-containing protein
MDKDIHSLKARELEVVLKISQAVSCTLDLKEILKMACQMTAQALNADRCSIGLLDTNGTYTITHSTYRRVSSYPSTAGEKFIVTHYPVIARKLRERKVIQIVQDQPVSFLSSKERRLLKQLHMKVFLAVPIIVEKKPLGAFHLARVEKSLPFSSFDISLCQTIANQIGIAIKNATLVKELKENHQLLERRSEDLRIRYQQQNLVLDISKSLFQSSNLQEVFNIITRKTCEALGLDRCTILQFDPEQREAVIRSVFHSSGEPSGKGTHDSADLGKKFQVNSFPQVLELLLKKGFLLTEDINSNPLLPRTRKYIKDLGVKSTLTIPFYSGKKISGSLQLSALKDYHHFSDSEIKFCQTIANLTSMAIQNVKLMQNLQEKSITLRQQTEALGKQYREQKILLEISKALSQTLDIKKLFEIVTRKTTELLEVERCSIMLMDETKGASIFYKVYSRGKYQLEYEGIQRSKDDFPILVSHLLRKPRLFCATDVSRSNLSSKEKKTFEKEGIKSLLVIPFYLAEKTLGLLALSTLHTQHKFTESEISAGQAIANQLSLTVENARLMQDIQEKNIKIQKQTEVLEKQFDEQRILLEISKALSQTLVLKKLFEIVTKKTTELLGIDRCVAMIFDAATGNTLSYIAYSEGRYLPKQKGLQGNLKDFPILFSQLMNKHIFYTSDIAKSILSAREKKACEKEGLKSLLNIPFILKGEIMGVFGLNTTKDPHEFSESEITLSQAIANQLSVAVENARLMQDLQEKVIKIHEQADILKKQFREQTILLELSKALSQTLDLKKLFEIVTKKTADLLEIDRCGVVLVDEVKGAALLVSIYADGRHQPPEESIRGSIKDFPVIFRHLKNKHRFHTPDISQSSLSSKEKKIFNKKEIKSLLVVPLSLTGRFLGLLSLSRVRKQHKFTESDARLCQAIANQLSVAVENARLMQDFQENSLKIQEQGKALEKQFKEQAILFEISKALSQTLDLKKLFEIVTQKTVELLGIDRVAAMIIDQKTGDFPLFIHFSRVKQPPELKIFPKSVRDFPYIIDQVRNDQIFCVPDVAKSSLTSKEKNYFRKRGIKSVLSIPFILRGRLLGVLALNSIREKHEFTEPEIKLSRAIANLLSVAVENANLMEVSKKHSEELEKLSLQIINAQEEERKNIAGKMHDVIGQDLSALQLDLKMSLQELPEQFAQTRIRLKEGEGLVKQALENVRNLTMDLRPPILDDFGLTSAIRWYVDGFSRRTNIKVALKLQELDCKFLPEFETAIYRTIQECLTNVAKHSEASRVNVSLDKKNDYLRIVIQDNGIGFNPEIFHFTSGFGLFRLKEKTELLGGKFGISSRRGKGTRVVIIFPCKDKEKK